MERRRFLHDVALWSAGAGASIPIFNMSREALAAENVARSTVGVAMGENWGALVEQALAPLGGMGAFVKSGSKVFIKPNASFDRTPEQGSNTHPDVCRAVIEQCLAAGASKVTVFDRTLAEERRAYVNSGIGPMIESFTDKRLELQNTAERKYVPIKIAKGIAFTKWKFYKDALDADVYINVPVAKHHGSAGLTLGLKNTLGIIGGNRQKIHWDLHQGIVDLNTVVKNHLTIVDGTRILLRNGPSGGDLADVEVKNTVIASADVVAADAYAIKSLFDKDPMTIEHVKIANQTGLGEIDLAKIKVLKA